MGLWSLQTLTPHSQDPNAGERTGDVYSWLPLSVRAWSLITVGRRDARFGLVVLADKRPEVSPDPDTARSEAQQDAEQAEDPEYGDEEGDDGGE